MSSKRFAEAIESPDYVDDADLGKSYGLRGGTLQDRQDMWRVGREQELNVRVNQNKKKKNLFQYS